MSAESIDRLLIQSKQMISVDLGIPDAEARIEAQILLRHVLGGVSRAWLISHEAQALTIEQRSLFDGLLQRRLQGEPVAYILGQREFYGLEFNLTPDVLIPRPDTETLVDAALQHIPVDRACTVLDLGTGSGVVAIAIASLRPQASVVAVERSDKALAVARVNAERLLPPATAMVGGRPGRNLRLLQSDWFSALTRQVFDVIVSNPPYIAANDSHLHQGDLRFEPASALASGLDGLDDIRTIVAQAPDFLAQGGWLLLEHGYNQAEQIVDLLLHAGFESISHVADLAGIRRVTAGKRACS